MPADRFYTDSELVSNLNLTGTEFHHLAHVMKIREGEEIELVNGKGSLAKAKVISISKHAASLHILSLETSPIGTPYILLAIPLMRPAKLEYIIEKGTELGADGFYLYPAQHSEKNTLSPNQLERLEHIAISAMKQCGRLDLPPIKVLKKLDDVFEMDATFLFGDTKTNQNKEIPEKRPLIFITGPERGFSEKEDQLLEKKGIGVTLHKNILRAETAPIAALCIYGATSSS